MACWSSIPMLGSSMWTEWVPWWTAQVRKINPVASPRRLVLICLVVISPEMMM
jgi:hypothetical protein